MQSSKLTAAAVMAFGAFTTVLTGQTFYGSLLGTVTDASSAAMPGAAVSLTNTGTGERRTATTGSEGEYRFVNLVPGNYRIEVEQQGFKRYTRDQIGVNVEAAVRIDVAMQLGDVNQTVEISSEAPLLQTENASLSQVVGARSVQQLPLNGRNVLNLVALVPGVVPQGSSEGNMTGRNVFSAGNYQIGGGTANQSAAYFDGAPMNTAYGNSIVLVPIQDAVAEFRVQTNNNSAEYGRYTGGVINMASRSGSNEFHGGAYEYLRNKVLNANSFFANSTGAGKAAFVQNQFGANVGGPIKKDRLFFFASYEGYRQRVPRLFLQTVPTEPMLRGDFSDYRDAAGNVIPIYDALTNCGALGNEACVAGATVQRTQFPGNIVPASRIDPVSRKFLDFPIYAKPNSPGARFTQLFNYSKQASGGGNNDQGNFRGDWNVSANQRVFARYTRWKSTSVRIDVYGNKLYGNAPEDFITDQAVLADTYTLSPTTLLDFRVSFLRWFYDRTPGDLGVKLSSTLGLPSYFDQLPVLNGVDPSTTVPTIAAAPYTMGGTGRIASRNNNYSIAPTLTKTLGRHTWKFGGELRRLDWNYFQNNTPGGTFTFTNLLTSRNALNPGATGNPFASFLLGYTAAGTVQASPFTATAPRYQGYFANDTFQATKRLTLTLGVRWEIPGVYNERFDRLVSFNQSLPNPAVSGITVNGQALKGTFVLVNSPDHPERGLRPEDFKLFAPRVGIAYRLSDRTVIRTGGGAFYIPSDVKFQEGPYRNPISIFNNAMVGTQDNSVTPANLLSNPYPNGFFAAPGRDPSYQRLLLGGAQITPLRHAKYGNTWQWNFTLQHQLPGGFAVEAAYAALRGLHLPNGGQELNQLPDEYLSMGAALQTQVANPFFGLVRNGALSRATVQRAQLLRPFPQYDSVQDVGGYVGNVSYHSMQVKMEKRMHTGGTVLASYTFSKNITDVETVTTWLDPVAGFQNFNNLRLERSLSSFDSRQRLVVSYVADLPIGKGQKFLTNASGVAGKLVSGWGINGVSTFQMGFPLGFTAAPNLTNSQGGNLRPNVVAGCQAKREEPAQSRLRAWFNTSCFTVPGPFTFGTASRTDPAVRGPGINNFNFALFKKTAVTERTNLEFRVEAFNLFNRVQFGRPDTVATTAANATFGLINTQFNDPRLIQLALRLAF